MTRIIMCGCNGAMGRMITGIVQDDPEAEIVAGIDMIDKGDNTYPVYQKLADCSVQADAIIDFSTPKILTELLAYSREKKVPVVLCTTGYSEEQLGEIGYFEIRQYVSWDQYSSETCTGCGQSICHRGV